MKAIYEYTDYRDFLKAALPTHGPKRGSRNRLAEELNCQKGYISQSLSGLSHFSLEHGIKISRFLSLDGHEEEYFLLLLHKGRAGSKDLEKFYDKKLLEIQEKRKQIKERIRAHSDLSETEQMTYYSSWLYTAVHMCLMVPELQSKSAISTFLGIGTQTVAKTLDFLIQVGLAKQDGEKITAGSARIHLPSQSHLVAKHHTNWRMRAIDSLDNAKEQDLHYSLIMSISEKAGDEIREILLKAIQDTEPVMKAAEDKHVYSLNVDLFSLKK